MTSKPPIPYYPDWKLEKALENNLLLYRIFERRVLFYRNVTRIPRYGVKIWIFIDRVYSWFSNGTRERTISAGEITDWVLKVDKDLDDLVTRHREKVGITEKRRKR